MEFAHHKAARSGVPVERVELYSQNTARSIRAFAQEMECAGIVLVVRRGSGVLLATHEVKQLLEEKCLPIYVVSLLAKKRPFPLPQWFPAGFGRNMTDSSLSSRILRWNVFYEQARYQSHD